MDKISNNQQSIPIWDRRNRDGGHRSSVDKAVQAHRDQVAMRQERTEARLAAANSINQSFFPQANYADRYATGAEMNRYDFQYNAEPQVTLDQPIRTNVPQNPVATDDLYQQLDVSPVYAYADEVVEKDGIEAAQELQSEEVPKGTYIDYEV